jgi:acyl-CoA dehydrogenase
MGQQDLALLRATAANAVPPQDIRERIEAVAAVASRHAQEVDAQGRFPAEAIAQLKAERLLGLMVPASLGGEGASLSDIADICFKLGRACSSTAMIFAMHQVKAACLTRHGGGDAWQASFLQRLADEQLLLGSSTTEGGSGGAVRLSSAPVIAEGRRFRLTRDASVISYGAQADAIVTTARRSPDAAPSDQVLVALPRETYRLEQTGEWNTLGMRGTCSLGFRLEAEGDVAQVLPAPYADIHTQTMTPAAHLLWGAAWAGIAAEAVDRARLLVRKASMTGAPPPAAAHLMRANGGLKTVCDLLTAALARHEAIKDDPAALSAVAYQTAIMVLKVEVSEHAVASVLSALRAAGLTGYRNEGPCSIARLLRDILSAPLMINNDRILADVSAAALIDRPPTSLRA